jgi:hypothetical protein
MMRKLDRETLRRLQCRVVTEAEFRAGYGSCSRCPCQAYEGSDVACNNCGHAYHDHY